MSPRRGTPTVIVDSVDTGVHTGPMSKDMWAVKAGPVVIGGVEDRKPPTASDRRWTLAAWIITVLLIGSASPMLGVILILGTAIYLAAATAPSGDTDEGKVQR
jgi:hypothetical protein